MLQRNSHRHSAIATALVRGIPERPSIKGNVRFQQMNNGVLVTAQIFGLPHSDALCTGGIFGFHIHEGGSCTGNAVDPLADTKGHYNPNDCAHPYHAGDLPPLFENNGYAYLSVLTNRFTVREIIGHTVVIHSQPDDFTSQPSGNSGEKIACGVIR